MGFFLSLFFCNHVTAEHLSKNYFLKLFYYVFQRTICSKHVYNKSRELVTLEVDTHMRSVAGNVILDTRVDKECDELGTSSVFDQKSSSVM